MFRKGLGVFMLLANVGAACYFKNILCLKQLQSLLLEAVARLEITPNHTFNVRVGGILKIVLFGSAFLGTYLVSDNKPFTWFSA